MNWQGLGLGALWLLVGSIVRVVFPYLIAGATAVQDGGKWPKWEWKYAGQVGVFFLGYIGILLASEGAREALSAMDAWAVFGIGYGGGDIVREAFKLLSHQTVRQS